MESTDLGIVDRTSMHLFYDKLYTTREKRPPLKTLVLITDLKVGDLPKILAERAKLSQYFVNITPLRDGLYRVFLRRMIGLREIRSEVIIDAAYEGVWVILTNAESYFIAHVLERFFDRLYPMVSRLYLNYSQMRLLLKRARESCRGKTKLTFFTIEREKGKLPERVFPKRKGTELLWDEDVDDEIKRLLSEGFIVKVNRLDFVLTDEKGATILKAQITRRGLAKLKFGSFSAFYENIVLRTTDYGLDQKRFYDKRERRVEEGKVLLRPLKIDYAFSFRSDQTNRFARRITNAYSCSVIHGGNPYFVANLCDYEDGSSFGVAILGSSITITPITRATSAAVWRLLDKIQEIMGDGQIADVQ